MHGKVEISVKKAPSQDDSFFTSYDILVEDEG
jgi:hypothetical protein